MEKNDSSPSEGNNIQANPEAQIYARLVCTTIKENFKHVFDNKEEEWAKQTLLGLNKIMNIWVIQRDSAEVLPAIQNGPLTMEDINPHVDSPFLSEEWPETFELQNITRTNVVQRTKQDVCDEGEGAYISMPVHLIMKMPPWEKIFFHDVDPPFPETYKRTTVMLKLGMSLAQQFAFLANHKDNPLTELIIKRINRVYNFEQEDRYNNPKDGPYKYEMKHFEQFAWRYGYDSDEPKKKDAKKAAASKKRKAKNDK